MITLLIGTCDSYSYLWDNFVNLCDKHWLVDSKKIFISESKLADFIGYETHTTGDGMWTDRMLSAIKHVETEYTFFVLEDYFLTEAICQADIDTYIKFIEKFNANKIMIEPLSYLMKYDMKNHTNYEGRSVYKIMDNSDFLTSVQPSVWKTEHLLKVMKPGWSPWEFECSGTDLIRGEENKIYNVSNTNAPRTEKIYWNAVRKGGIISEGWNEIKNRFNLKEMRRLNK